MADTAVAPGLWQPSTLTHYASFVKASGARSSNRIMRTTTTRAWSSTECSTAGRR